MKRFLWIASLLWLAFAPTALSQTVDAITSSAPATARFFGAARYADVQVSKGMQTQTAGRGAVLGFSDGPDARFRPEPVWVGKPLIEPRGLVKGKGFLYISDCGRDKEHDDAPTIWRLEPVAKKLDVFYRGPMLKCSKWLWFLEAQDGRPDELIISDFGEEAGYHSQGTGVGAKVFAIAVKPDGSAGDLRVLHEGAPLRNPQGVTVIGKTVIVADTRAGELAHRKDAPDISFANGAVFAIPLEGGKPERLFANETFVTLVGSCLYEEGSDWYLRLWDIDGGRRDTSPMARAAHSGFASLKRTRVESLHPLRLGPLEEVPLVEEFPIELELKEPVEGQSVVLEGVEGTTFFGGTNVLALSDSEAVAGKFSLIAESPSFRPLIKIDANILDATGKIVGSRRLEIIKNPDVLGPVQDNKHAGRVAASAPIRLDSSVDGLSGSLALFPPAGGVPGLLWRGAPLREPMSSQPSWDEKFIWVTDMSGGPEKTGAVWQIPVPSYAEIAQMYSPGNAWRLKNPLQDR